MAGNSDKEKSTDKTPVSTKNRETDKTPASVRNRHRSRSEKPRDDEDPWTCEMCKKVFTDPSARLLECQRCKNHFCIKCLNKPTAEYNILQKSDSMWFCVNCRSIIERNIITDLKIEDRCKEIMQHYEKRISTLEDEMKTKCDEKTVKNLISEEMKKSRGDERVKEIVTEEIKKSNEENTASGGRPISYEIPKITEDVISEINERKIREKNVVIYGSQEEKIADMGERKEADKLLAEDILKHCDIAVENTTVSKAIRLGKYRETITEEGERKGRPLLVVLENKELKATIFKNMPKLKDTKYSKIRIANDLTSEERNKEKELYEEAKKLEAEASGDYMFRVRGPPWARRVVKIAKTK